MKVFFVLIPSSIKRLICSQLLVPKLQLQEMYHVNHYFYYLFFSKINHLFNPAIPAEHKLLFAHAAVSGDIEDHEEVTDQLGVHPDHSGSHKIKDFLKTYL